MALDWLDKMSTRSHQRPQQGAEETELGDFKLSTLGMALAAVLFLVAAVGVSFGSISLLALGLAVLAGSFVLERMKM